MLSLIAATTESLVMPQVPTVGRALAAARAPALVAQQQGGQSFDDYMRERESGSETGEQTRDDGEAVYGANEGWDEANKAKEGGKSTMSQDFEATDTPDFFDDSEYSQKASRIGYMDGIGGSPTGANADKSKSHNPGIEGALEVNPDIYVPEAEVFNAEADGVVFELPKSGMTDLDFEMFTIGGDVKDLDIAVRPVAMTFEPFYAGFTANSHPAFSVYPPNGKMERRNGDPTVLTVTVNPGNEKGEITGYLCCILPEEKMFSTYYEIKCMCR